VKKAPPNVKFKQDTFCSYCGSQFTEQALWPRKCFTCWNESYKNPAPVVVALVPVGNGLLIEERNIEPGKGGLAFPSGYVNYGETWQQAIVRELREEVGLETEEREFDLLDILPSSNHNMLVFCLWLGHIPYLEALPFLSNEEVSAIFQAQFDAKLVFPSHNEMLGRYFSGV
jgi:8-oxo-dGTP diphosphatase